MPSSLHIDLQSDFFGSVLSLAMLPMAITYGAGLLSVSFFWRKAQRALALAYKKDAQRREAEQIVQTMQRITILLAEHLSTHNTEILNWVEDRIKKKGSAPPRIQRSSYKIAEVMKVLSKVSFVSPYLEKHPITVSDLEKILIENLDDH